MSDDLFSHKDKMPQAPKNTNGSKAEKRHWVDYAATIAASAAAFVAAVAAGVGFYQASIARDTEQRQLRAYVGVTQSGVENFGDSVKQTLKITRKNYGLTPAYHVFTPPALLDVIRIGANLPTTLDAKAPANREAFPSLFPSMEWPFYNKGNGFSDQQLNLIRDGREYTMVYFGVIYYDDAFGDTHYTRYCWLFKGSGMTDKDADACIGHNDSN